MGSYLKLQTSKVEREGAKMTCRDIFHIFYVGKNCRVVFFIVVANYYNIEGMRAFIIFKNASAINIIK